MEILDHPKTVTDTHASTERKDKRGRSSYEPEHKIAKDVKEVKELCLLCVNFRTNCNT